MKGAVRGPVRGDGDAPGHSAVPGGPVDVAVAARELIAGLAAQPWGQVSPSVYETGRLVSLASWLTGHAQRVRFLLTAQRPDGAWGGPDGYALVPTLSATDALLSLLGRRDTDHGVAHADLTMAAGRGLRALARLIPALDAASVPDMPAIDIIAAALVDSINRRLDDGRGAPPGHGPADAVRPRLPAGLDASRLGIVRAVLEAGAAPPEKLLHALEVGGDAARGARTIRPAATGTIGASPAATAAWLDEHGAADSGNPARRFLETVSGHHGGPVPCGIPITLFERAWVLGGLARAGIAMDVPAKLMATLRTALDPGGAPAGDGLPADADTTSAALYALGLLGVPYRPDNLWAYQLNTRFCTWPGEDGFSVTTNAHVLEAFGHFAGRSPDRTPRHAATVAGLCALLADHQRPDGSWLDRWHASPYYATACCALALDRFGGGRSAAAVRRAVRWVIETQRSDGSWGRWDGTAEETAYAMQILLLTRPAENGSRATAAARGHSYLLAHVDEPDDPPLWHDKDLYRPTAIVRAAVLAALHLARRDPAVAALSDVTDGAMHA